VDLFEALQGETLRVDLEAPEGRQVELLLSKVRRLPMQGPPRRLPFALDLSGSAAEPLQQGTYRFNHPRFGSQSIFIVPVAEDRSNRFYEAIFN
jgi:hypothetical protein